MQRHPYLLLAVALLFGFSLLAPGKSSMLLVCHLTGEATEVYNSGIAAEPAVVSGDDCCEKEAGDNETLTKAACCDLMPSLVYQTQSAAQIQTRDRAEAFAAVLLPAPVASVSSSASEIVCDAPISAAAPPRAPPPIHPHCSRAPPVFF